jgi:hypothetical protein
MEDIIDIIVTETTNTIEITAQPNDEIIDVNIIDNREDIVLNVTPTVVEVNINTLTGNFGVFWGDIQGDLENQEDLQDALDLKADLVDGKVPSSQLPSYVDDVVEVATFSALPATGEIGKIYVILDTNKIYRWSGSTYVEIADSTAVWGAITGTLSSQTDLQSALNAKQNQLNGTGFVKASGTTISYDNSTYLTTSSAASSYVPYTGATANVDLGTHTLLAAKGTFSSSGSSDTVGITHSSGSGIALNITKGGNGEGIYVNKTSGSGNAVTIVGTLNATTLVRNGGTSSQFLKADGSVDSSVYALDSAVVKLTGNQSIAGLKTFTTGIVADVTTGGTQGFASTNTSASGSSIFLQNNSTSVGNAIGINNTSTADGIAIGNDTSGRAIYISNATASGSGKGISIDNYNGGIGIEVGSDSSADAIKVLHLSGRAFNIQSSGGGYGVIINNTTASTSAPFTIQKQGASVITLTDAGAGVFSSSVRSSGYYLTGMTSGSGALYYNSGANRVTVANYNTSGILDFEVNGGASALTLNADLSATFKAGGSFAGALTTTGGTRSIQLVSFASDYNYIRSNGAQLVVGTQDSNDLFIQTNNTTRLTFVGGTGAATFTSSIDVNSYIRNTNVGANAAVTIAADGTSHYIQSTNAARTVYNKLLLNPYGANVGIGSTTADVPFEIHAGRTTDPPSLGAKGGTIAMLFNDSANGSYGLLMGLAGANVYLQNQRTDGDATAYNLLLQPRGGNVGIGTTAPTFAGGGGLHINQGGTDTRLHLTNSTTGSAATDGFELALVANDVYYDSKESTGAHLFYTAGSPRMIINSGGNVGIGTISPANPPGFVRVLNISAADAALVISNTSGTAKNWTIGALDSGSLGIFDGSSERMRITSDGYTRLSSTSGGIQFNGDTSAANALDDYEEGTWTPRLIGGGSGEASYTSRNATYTKIGRQVTLIYQIFFQKNTMTGGFRLADFPFTLLSNSGTHYPQGTVLLDNLAVATNNITFQGGAGSTSGDFIDDNGSMVSHSGFQTTKLGLGTMCLRGTLTYFTA